MLRKSARVQQAIQILKEEGMRINEIANEINISRQAVGNMAHNRRTMPSDIAENSLAKFENGLYALSIMFEFSDNQTPPALLGKGIDRHRIAYLSLLESEENDLKTKKNSIIRVLSKEPKALSREELMQIEELLSELTDVYAITANALANITDTYKYSMKYMVKKRKPVWKQWGWI